MSGLIPTEKRFEAHIEEHLSKTGYTKTHFSEYDKELCLIKDQLLNFVKKTQPKEWDELKNIYGTSAENKLCARVSESVAKHGVIHVLRGEVVDRGVRFKLCYFEPKSDLNPEHQKLYNKNQFSVVRQLHYSTRNEKSLDMVLFLNGIPVVTMELKNQLTGQNIQNSENQYRLDRDPKEPLFKFKRCLVHFCVDNDKVSMTTKLEGKKTLFLPYNRGLENPSVQNGYKTKYLWEEVLTPKSLLDTIENFAHLALDTQDSYNDKTEGIEKRTKETLIFPRYHQRDLILKFRKRLKEDGVGKNYLVQHTTGSGKSYSIGWLSLTLTSLYQKEGDTKRMFDTIIVVTDRTVLDDQLKQTIGSLAKNDGVVNAVNHGSQELKKFLEQGKDIVVTTIQKFPYISQTISALSGRTFGVIIDEVHSSQTGELSKELKKSLSKTAPEGEELDEDQYDYQQMLIREVEHRGPQKHISFFGFTGTPKEKTLELFGTKNKSGQFEPFHIYSMYQSIHEGFTLDVLQNYTTYERYFKVKQTEGEDKKVPPKKGKQELIRFVDLDKLTIQRKVEIILEHWVNKGSKEIKNRSKGMVVTQSRKHCVLYFKEINKQLQDRGLKYKCLVGFSGEVEVNGQKYTEQGLNKTLGHETNVPFGLKTPKFRLLVVANKFQTGFDEPLVQSMYVDKNLGGVQCVQTLSRLNRTTKAKTQTFVLDFVNNPTDITKAFQSFYKSTILEEETDPNRLYDTLEEIYKFHLYTDEDVNRFCKIFFDNKRDEGALHAALDNIADKFTSIKDDQTKDDFRSKIQSYIRMYGYLSQIIDFTDVKLEKSFIFLKFLNKKLPKRDTGKLDISDTIDLESLRIQKIHEQNYKLSSEDTTLKPPAFETSGQVEPEYDLWSEIINEANSIHGANLTEEDRTDIYMLKKRLSEKTKIKTYMTAQNTETNKQNYFTDEAQKTLNSYVNDKFDFYKKVQENEKVKSMIFRKLYEDYQRQLN